MQVRASTAAPRSCASPKLLLLGCSTFLGILPQSRLAYLALTTSTLWPAGRGRDKAVSILALSGHFPEVSHQTSPYMSWPLQGPPSWVGGKKCGLFSREHCAQRNIRNSITLSRRKQEDVLEKTCRLFHRPHLHLFLWWFSSLSFLEKSEQKIWLFYKNIKHPTL